MRGDEGAGCIGAAAPDRFLQYAKQVVGVSALDPHRVPQGHPAPHDFPAQLALKCADLGHLTSPREVHKKWVHALEEEFFKQVGYRG